jgi:CheY-like chemotaxis protein
MGSEHKTARSRPLNDSGQQMRPLTRRQALDRLASVPFGRVVFTHHAMPSIRPVNHVVRDGQVIIRTHEDSAFTSCAGHGHPNVVVYEADDIDPDTRTGWTVTVTGLARLVEDPARAARYRDMLHPWVSGSMSAVISIDAEFVTGFKLGLPAAYRLGGPADSCRAVGVGDLVALVITRQGRTAFPGYIRTASGWTLKRTRLRIWCRTRSVPKSATGVSIACPIAHSGTPGVTPGYAGCHTGHAEERGPLCTWSFRLPLTPASCNANACVWCHHGLVQLRCVIVDDDGAFLNVARALLEGEGVTVAGMAGNLAEAVERARTLRPDVVLIDIRLSEESGFDVARELAAQDQATALIMISSHREADYADLIAESPVIGFLTKTDLSAAAIYRLLQAADAAPGADSGHGR